MIPAAVMRELRYIEVYTAKKIRNLRVGAYTSPLRGPGFDFDEHQPYRPGDDVRRIDWNVTARMNAPYVRHTHAEREMNVMIALDVSRFLAIDVFKAAMDRQLHDLKSSPVMPGFDSIRMPGEQRLARRTDRSRNGVPVVAEVVAQLDKLAAELKIAPLRER